MIHTIKRESTNLGSLFLLCILRRNGLKMLSGIIVHLIVDNGFQTIQDTLRIKEMDYMLTIYIQ